MTFKAILISFSLFFFTINSFSQKKQTTEQYIKKYYKIAIREMKFYKIPASITLAQGILESASGNSNLARKAKNHFGIKCHKSWTGKRFYMDDDTKDECFRVYKNPESSYKDHSQFLTRRGRYEFLFESYATTDYKKWAHGLKKAGYATNPKYPKLLINIIEKHHLYKYDRKDYVPEGKIVITEIKEEVKEEELILEEVKEEEFVIEETDEYIKALMGRNVYYSNKEKGIFIFNRIKTIKAKGRTPLEIAIEFDINFEQLMKYNDLINNELFKDPMQNVFLQPKRRKGSQKDYMVKPGDSLWEISQMFGIRISRIFKYNFLDLDEQVKPGEIINLRKKRKTEITTISYADVLKAKRKFKKETPKKVVKKIKIQPTETIININIIDKTENKKIEVETVKSKVNSGMFIKTSNNKKEEYQKGKYIDKNEEIEKIINQIPVEKHEEQEKYDVIKIDIAKKYSVKTHIVKQGETLYFISRKFNISIGELKKLNNLQDNSINIGQELILSQ